MPKNRRQRALTILAAVVVAGSACSQPTSNPAAPEAAIDGELLMRQMSDTLANASAFRFTTHESLEPIEPQLDGEVLRFSRTVTVRRPDGMSFELKSAGDPAVEVSACYEGSTVSLWDAAAGVWAQTEVPGTLDEMLDDIALRYSVPVPIADVVYSTPYDAFVGPDTTGGFVGREVIDGVECAYLLYEDAWVDVHIWIPLSGQPLPRRVILVYKQVPGAPRAEIDYTGWELDPQDVMGVCTFDPAPDATRVAFEDFVAALFAGAAPEVPAASDPFDDGTADGE
jgi:hypothetical protein